MSAVLCALAVAGSAPASCAPSGPSWRVMATRADASRLREWREAFVKALGEARAAHAADVEREGVLLHPDAALPQPAIPAGRYSCRTIKLGSQGGSSLAYVAYRPFACEVRVEGGRVRFAKLTGSQRPVGAIYAGDDRKLVFLGTMLLGDETGALRYGVDPDRNVAGQIERIGPDRWRLIVPYPRFESTLDVTELVPSR